MGQLYSCEMSSTLWNSIFNFEGLAWVMPRRVIDLFVCWKGQFCRLRNAECGRWFYLASCGVFQGREMVGVLKTVNGRWWKFQRPFDICLRFKFSSFHVFIDLFSSSC